MDSAPWIVLLLVLAGGLLGLAIVVLWIWSLVHCAMNQRLSDGNRIAGLLLIVLLGPLGSLIYLFLPREPVRAPAPGLPPRQHEHLPGGMTRE